MSTPMSYAEAYELVISAASNTANKVYSMATNEYFVRLQEAVKIVEAGHTKNMLKLDMVSKAARDAASLYSMDNNDPPDEIDEIIAILDEVACTECGDYRRDRRFPRKHYTHCSKYGEVL